MATVRRVVRHVYDKIWTLTNLDLSYKKRALRESCAAPIRRVFPNPVTYSRGIGRWFGKGGLYRSIGKGSMISVYKIESSYVTLRKYRGTPAPGASMVPTLMIL